MSSSLIFDASYTVMPGVVLIEQSLTFIS